MRTNGYLTYRVSDGNPSFNELGEPIATDSVWSEPVECFIKTNTHNNKGTYEDGHFTNESYEVIVEKEPLETDRIRLTRTDIAKELGEFDVQDIRKISLDRVIIIV